MIVIKRVAGKGRRTIDSDQCMRRCEGLGDVVGLGSFATGRIEQMRHEILERLKGDHVRFERLFRAIEEQCSRLEAGQPADLARLRSITDYLGKFALPRHHALEDAIFAQIVKRMPRFRTDIFDLPEDHHTSKREFINFCTAVERGDDDLAELARSFVANERGHFIAEEEIVFHYASKHLTAEQWDELRAGLRVVESEGIRPEKSDLIADLLT